MWGVGGLQVHEIRSRSLLYMEVVEVVEVVCWIFSKKQIFVLRTRFSRLI